MPYALVSVCVRELLCVWFMQDLPSRIPNHHHPHSGKKEGKAWYLLKDRLPSHHLVEPDLRYGSRHPQDGHLRECFGPVRHSIDTHWPNESLCKPRAAGRRVRSDRHGLDKPWSLSDLENLQSHTSEAWLFAKQQAPIHKVQIQAKWFSAAPGPTWKWYRDMGGTDATGALELEIHSTSIKPTIVRCQWEGDRRP